MPIYDCRKEGREPGSISFPCSVQIIDPVTGARIPNVFYLSTQPAQLGRFVTGLDGEPMADASKKTKRIIEENGHRRVEFDYARLEIWEARPWVAVAIQGGGVIAKSEGVP